MLSCSFVRAKDKTAVRDDGLALFLYSRIENFNVLALGTIKQRRAFRSVEVSNFYIRRDSSKSGLLLLIFTNPFCYTLI